MPSTDDCLFLPNIQIYYEEKINNNLKFLD